MSATVFENVFNSRQVSKIKTIVVNSTMVVTLLSATIALINIFA